MSLIKEYFTQEKTEVHLWTHLYRKHRKAYHRLKQYYACLSGF